jgi:hypothetical protein
MEQPATSEHDTVGLAEPVELPLLGEGETRPSAADNTTALLVFHGMGQQVRFETLDMIAQAVIDEHIVAGGTADKRVRHVWCQDGGTGWFLARAEIDLRNAKGESKYVHVYEAYWAPITEGAISFLSTAAFYLGAGWRGFLSTLKHGRKFERWAFGREQWFPLTVGTSGHLLLALVVLAAVVVALTVGTYFLWPTDLTHPITFSKVVKALPSIALGLILFEVIRRTRRWMVEFLGDVAIYLSSEKLDEYWRIRDEIKRDCCRVANLVFRALARQDGKTLLAYDRVVVAGHSLGSVVAYDSLNTLIQRDIAKDAARRLGIAERSSTFITFGSPLDKVAFIFGTKIAGRKIREALAGGVQPLIVHYKFRPARWLNIYAPGDIIAGALDYYDDPGSTDGGSKRVENLVDREAGWFPPNAHTGYWEHQAFRTALYRMVSG